VFSLGGGQDTEDSLKKIHEKKIAIVRKSTRALLEQVADTEFNVAPLHLDLVM
jgi:hypothetical protein